MLKTIIEVFISVFFIFGLYCATHEIGKLALRIINSRREKIDNGNKTDYNNNSSKITDTGCDNADTDNTEKPGGKNALK